MLGESGLDRQQVALQYHGMDDSDSFANSIVGPSPRVPSVVEAYSNFGLAMAHMALCKDQNLKLRTALNQFYNLFQEEQRRSTEKSRQLQETKDLAEKRAKLEVDRLKTEVTKLQDHLAQVMLEVMELKAEKQKLEDELAAMSQRLGGVVPVPLEPDVEPSAAQAVIPTAAPGPLAISQTSAASLSEDMMPSATTLQEPLHVQYSDQLDAPVVAFMRSMLHEPYGLAEDSPAIAPTPIMEDPVSQAQYAGNLKSLYLCFTDRTWQGQLLHANRARDYLREVVDMMSVDTLKRHLHGEGPMQCKLCNLYFNDFLAYVVHLVLPMHVLRSDIAQACLLKATLRREYPLSPQELQDVCKRLLDIVSIRWVGYDCVACDKHCEDVKSYAEHCRTQQHIMSMAALINELCEAEQGEGDATSAAFLRCVLDTSLLLLKACEISHCIYHLKKEMTVGVSSQVHDRTLDQLNADYTKICHEYDAACFDIFGNPQSFDPLQYTTRVPKAEASRLLALKPPRCRRGKRGKASGMRIVDDFTEERRRRLGLPAPAASSQLPPELLALSGPMGELLRSQMLAKGGVLASGDGMALPTLHSMHSMPSFPVHGAARMHLPHGSRDTDFMPPGHQLLHASSAPLPGSLLPPHPPNSVQTTQLINSMLQSMAAAAMLPRSTSNSCQESMCSDDSCEPFPSTMDFVPTQRNVFSNSYGHSYSARDGRHFDISMLPPAQPAPPARSASSSSYSTDQDSTSLFPQHGGWPPLVSGSTSDNAATGTNAGPSAAPDAAGLGRPLAELQPPTVRGCPPADPPPVTRTVPSPRKFLAPRGPGDNDVLRELGSPARRQRLLQDTQLPGATRSKGAALTGDALMRTGKTGFTPRFRDDDLRPQDDQGKRGRDQCSDRCCPPVEELREHEDEEAFLRRLGWTVEEDGEQWALTPEQMANYGGVDGIGRDC